MMTDLDALADYLKEQGRDDLAGIAEQAIRDNRRLRATIYTIKVTHAMEALCASDQAWCHTFDMPMPDSTSVAWAAP
jgi:hypothetical protein